MNSDEKKYTSRSRAKGNDIVPDGVKERSQYRQFKEIGLPDTVRSRSKRSN